MKIAKLELTNGLYFYDELVGENTGFLIEFLISDVGYYGESFIKFIYDPDRKRTTSNYSRLVKEGDDVLIGCQFDEYSYEDCVRMSQKNFLYMLDQWRKLVKQKPQEIIVFKEGESYRLEGHGFPDKKE